jgi:hypothetical protein
VAPAEIEEPDEEEVRLVWRAFQLGRRRVDAITPPDRDHDDSWEYSKRRVAALVELA